MGEWTEQDSRALTVALVAIDGHRIALRGAEKTEAVQIMVGRGLDTETIAERLRTTPERLRPWARRHGIELPPMRPPQEWWVTAAWPSMSSTARARQRRERAARLAEEVAA